MKCIVCVKQVPDTANVEVDPVTGVLKRDGTQSKLNPYDLYALETAMRLKGTAGGGVQRQLFFYYILKLLSFKVSGDIIYILKT